MYTTAVSVYRLTVYCRTDSRTSSAVLADSLTLLLRSRPRESKRWSNGPVESLTHDEYNVIRLQQLLEMMLVC